MITQKIQSLQQKIENIARIHQDKILHFIVGYLLFAVVQLFVCGWLALGLVAIVAMLKELFDTLKNEPTGWGWLDFLFTILGALPAFLITL